MDFVCKLYGKTYAVPVTVALVGVATLNLALPAPLDEDKGGGKARFNVATPTNATVTVLGNRFRSPLDEDLLTGLVWIPVRNALSRSLLKLHQM